MTPRWAAGESVRERDQRDARFFAWDVPGDAHIVALVHDADEADGSVILHLDSGDVIGGTSGPDRVMSCRSKRCHGDDEGNRRDSRS